MDLTDLKDKNLDDLTLLAQDCGISSPRDKKRADLVLAIMRAHSRKGQVRGSGVLEVLADGFGFLRSPDSNFTPGPDDIYVSPSQIRRFHLRTSDLIAGIVRPPKESERYYALLKVETINGLGPDERKKKLFDNLTPIYPSEPLALEHDGSPPFTRMVDLFSPIGKGQRVLLLSPPRAGKSNILRDIAKALSTNHPKVTTFVVLIAERPEEITDMQRSGIGEVLASSLDDPASRHSQVAELALEKAKRIAESGGDAVLVVDSMSRLARAFSSGLSPKQGGSRDAESSAVHQSAHKCRRFFGTARKLEEGGSLTIIAAANTKAIASNHNSSAETTSALDAAVEADLIEAASTLIALDPVLVSERVRPPFDLARSESRDADRLLESSTIDVCARLRRKLLKQEDRADAIDHLRDLFREHSTNAALFETLK